MININRFLQKSYELQQKQYELEVQNSKIKHEKSSNSSHSQYISQEQTLQQDQLYQSQPGIQNRVAYSFPLKINQVQQTEQSVFDQNIQNNYCSSQIQNSGTNMMASCAQFTFRNQNGSQKKIQSPALQSPIPPSTQSFSDNTIQNNIIMNNLMTQNSLNFNKEKKQNYQTLPHAFQNISNIHYEEIEHEDNNYTPISYNISSNLKWDYTISKTSQLQASSIQSQCLVDESAFSKQQINKPLLTEIPHYPMMEKANLEYNCNRLSEIPIQNQDQSFESKFLINSPQLPISGCFSPSKISDLSCLKIENFNPQYIENNVLVTNQWENNPQSTNLTMNSIINGGVLNFHINLNSNNNNKQQIEPNNRYNNVEQSCHEQDLFEQIPMDNITSQVVKNFESMESSISYNHSASIVSDALQENQQKNTSLKQELENIINSTRENTNQIPLNTECNNGNRLPAEFKNQDSQPHKSELNYFQQQNSHFISSHASSNSQLQDQKNLLTFKSDIKEGLADNGNNDHQISEFDKENQEINYNYEPKSNRNYQVSVSTASSSDQFTHRQKQDTLRKLLSPQGHQELMSQFLGSSQTLSHFENNKQQLIPTDEFFQKSRQQLDSTRNNPNNILNILNRSRDMSPINQNSSGSKRIGGNQSMVNLQNLISSTRNTQTKQINLNYLASNNTQLSDKKQKIPKLSINISQADLKNSQTEFGKASVSPNRLFQSQSTKNILSSSRSGSNLRGAKQGTDGEDFKLFQISNTTRNKCISINIAQISNYVTQQAATTTNSSIGNKTPQLFKRLNNKSMSNATSTTTQQIANPTKTNNSISPTRKLQIQISQIISPTHHKNTSLSPNQNNQFVSLNKQNTMNKQKTPKNSENNQNTNIQNSAASPQRDILKQYQLIYKPEKKLSSINSNSSAAQMRRSNTQRYLLNNSNNNQNSCLNISKNNNNQSSFLNKSNELIKKNFQVIQSKNQAIKNLNAVQSKDFKLEKFYKTNQKQVDNIPKKSGLSQMISDRNQHKSINLNQLALNNNSSTNIKNTSNFNIPHLNNDENEQRVHEKLLEENCQQLKFSGIQINTQQKVISNNILTTPNSQSQKQILQKCLHSMVQIYCNICNRKSRNNIQQLLSKR
ncbi:hypothetical protein TTHERM_00565570 (macronuclear) [Tetrahymena thermophila SB210]|uniref:Uncharacterized protein n=1 Tax=Tetrahymena thermophila (strain SB210) TaxID=312017 RepID=I7LWH5_TETTS|nr:hypothetical protein TTHERM_00565570 [Tetrahymena thermophila SB210]EAS01812.3 hypothetical protein TTHERM_00565570 [Tetrahymena thermophila SB210]|eukprot:XP_001022057.3 hypothetical protein TTHERM_00565570 [Tetrahymena thermophila SB210]